MIKIQCKTECLHLLTMGYYYGLVIVQASPSFLNRTYKSSPFKSWLTMACPNVCACTIWGLFHPVGLKFSVISGVLAFGCHLALRVSILFLVDRAPLRSAKSFCLSFHISSFFSVFTIKQRRELTTPIWHEAQFMLSTIPYTLGWDALFCYNSTHGICWILCWNSRSICL